MSLKLTGLWLKKDGNKTYMMGTLGPNVTVFVSQNDFKKKDSDPDYFLSLAPKIKKEEQKEKPRSKPDFY